MDDPFNIFDAQPPKKSRVEQVAGPESSLLPLVRAFVVQNARRTSEDLLPQLAGSASSGAAASGAAPTSVADDLESLVALLQMESPKERADSIAPATRIEAATWSLLSQRGAWPHVAWREAYVLSQWVLSYTDAVRNAPTDALRRLDRAFILGGPSEMLRNAMAVMEAAIDTPATHATPLDAVIDTQPSEQVSSEKVSSEKVSSEKVSPGNAIGSTISTIDPARQIERAAHLTLDAFRPHWRANRPLVLGGLLDDWGAVSKWSLDWFRAVHGHRLVPVELGLMGGSTSRGKPPPAAAFGGKPPAAAAFGGKPPPAAASSETPSWHERTMALSDLIDTYLLPSARGDSAGIAYLAQHALFEQIPSLREDFQPPPHCELGRLQHVNVWMGTAGTVTPLHYDSYDNMLAQLSGYKYVRLYASDQSRYLYVERAAADGGLSAQGNMSSVEELEAPDLERYPLLGKARYTETVLGPGETLFIPARCWHYVRSLSSALSVSFWF
jgi:hypothetical protein|tara:strand:- start:1789 stop:3282 length:1494 start_codon:yes stop_codon:yes gene_type:complete